VGNHGKDVPSKKSGNCSFDVEANSSGDREETAAEVAEDLTNLNSLARRQMQKSPRDLPKGSKDRDKGADSNHSAEVKHHADCTKDFLVLLN
jgi:hypothetical protein